MAGSSQHQQDTTVDALLLTAVMVAAIAGLWMLWRESLIFLGFGFSLPVMAPFIMLESILSRINLPLAILAPVTEAWSLMTREPWGQIHDKFGFVMAISGRCLALLLLPVLLAGFIGSRAFRPDLVYRQRHDLESCINELGKHWSCARWLSSVNPAVEPDTAVPTDQVDGTNADYQDWLEGFHQSRDLSSRSGDNLPRSGSWLLPSIRPIYQPPPFGRALRPEEWIASHGLDRNMGVGDLLVGLEILLNRQLRSRWQGWEALQCHQQALLAALVLIRQGGGKPAENLMDDLMNMMAAGNKGDFALLFNDHPIKRQIEEVLSIHSDLICGLVKGHFWVETVLAEAWVTCREGKGVWPSARFQWLKIVDRPLWYTISSMGSHAVYVECAGILAHHQAERQLQMPLAVPLTKRAAEAIVYDYLDLAPERIRMRHERQNARTRTLPGEVAGGWE